MAGIQTSRKPKKLHLIDMKKKIAKTDIEWSIFQDFWKLTQEYMIAEDTEEYSKAVYNATTEFSEKYKGNRLALHLALALLKWIDEQQKEMRK